MIGPVHDDLERHLELASGLVEALLDKATHTLPLEALALLDKTNLAIALFPQGSTTPQHASSTWHSLFAVTPESLLEHITAVGRSRQPLHIPELVAEPGLRYCAARLAALPSAAGVSVVCICISDAIIARDLGVSASTLVWGADYRNRSWRDYTGGVRDWERAVHDRDLTRCHEALCEAARNRMSTAIEARLRRADGVYRWHSVEFVTQPPRWFGTARDIQDTRALASERDELIESARAARADAEQANRLKDEFLAYVAHELRAPITTLLLWEKVLRDPTADSATRHQALDAIRQSAQVQARLVADLLDVSRAIGDKLYIDLQPVDFDLVVGEALQAALPAALARRITLSHAGKRAGVVQGDSARLRQVLDNLLMNAIKFTEPGGRVVVTTQSDHGKLRLDVEDTGRGIAPEFLERIFEPFRQTGDRLTRREGGLGLGLAISRKLVELHDGTLVASSAGPGRGSTFTMTLPAARVPALEPPAAGAVSDAGHLEKKRVLVIDDDAHTRAALALLLADAGVVVDTADSAATGRRCMQLASPDAIICDIAMPDEDGYSFVRYLRSAGSRIPAIALTGFAMDAEVSRALDAGFDLHLAKPITFERLVTSLGTLIQRPVMET